MQIRRILMLVLFLGAILVAYQFGRIQGSAQPALKTPAVETRHVAVEKEPAKTIPITEPRYESISEKFDAIQNMSDAYGLLKAEFDKSTPLGRGADRSVIIELCKRFNARWPETSYLGLGLISECYAANGNSTLAINFRAQSADAFGNHLKSSDLKSGKSEAEASETAIRASAQNILLEANSFYAKKAYLQALEYYGLLRTNYPTSPEAPKAGFLSAECYAGTNQIPEAIQMLNQVIKETSNPYMIERSYVMMIELNHTSGDAEAMEKNLAAFAAVPGRGAEASNLRADMLFNEGAVSAKKAIEAYQQTKSRFPGTEYAKEADRMIGIIQEQVIKPFEAVKPPKPPETNKE